MAVRIHHRAPRDHMAKVAVVIAQCVDLQYDFLSYLHPRQRNTSMTLLICHSFTIKSVPLGGMSTVFR